jgi:hypothetical protein
MSTSPYYKIISKQIRLPNKIKYPLSKRYLDNDGSLSGSCQLTKQDITYLQSIQCLSEEHSEIFIACQKLINAIIKYGSILFIVE